MLNLRGRYFGIEEDGKGSRGGDIGRERVIDMWKFSGIEHTQFLWISTSTYWPAAKSNYFVASTTHASSENSSAWGA